MEVEIIWRETMKPETPTPSHLTNITFSLLDQKQRPTIVPTLLFYSAPVGTAPLDITRLKSCLSQTLTCFYPLAGRYETWGTTLCNDQGVPLVVARVNYPLSALLNSLTSSNSDVELIKFYPPKEKLLTSGIHVAIQINVFTCGGFALGWYHTHKVTDMTSAATFLRHWAALVSHRYEDAAQAQPDFNVGPTAYPPVPQEDRQLDREEKATAQDFLTGKHIVAKSFVFSNSAVAQLKAVSVSEKVANPSRFMAVAGFLWQQLMLASPQNNKAGKSIVNIPVDLRTRCDPTLPRGAMGNLVEMALARVDKRAPLPELVAEIHGSISKIKDVVAEYQGDKRAEAKEQQWQSFVKAVIENEVKDVYFVTAWCKSAGFSEVDFGYGKPDWIVPIDDKLRHEKKNLVYLTEYTGSDGDGFEAWMFLEEEHFKVLESNPDFIAFASPHF